MNARTPIAPVRTTTYQVCPRCKTAVQLTHGFSTREGVAIATYRCREHGDVVPMRSAVVNGSFQSENQI